MNENITPSPRLAERREDMSHPMLDVVISIPCHKEGYKILDSLLSIAEQQKYEDDVFVQGVVVVVNGKPSDSPEVKLLNSQTYRLLQFIQTPFAVSIAGDKESADKMRRIQESGLPIDVVDAFSEGHAHPENTVGYAREIGRRVAHSRLRAGDAESRYMQMIHSLDADSQYGPKALAEVRRARRNREGDVFSLATQWNVDSLSKEDEWASSMFDLGHTLQTFIAFTEDEAFELMGGGDLPYYKPKADLSINEGVVWLGGASTALSAEILAQTPGYDPKLGAGEDAQIGYEMRKVGAIVASLRNKYPEAVVFIEPRSSDRTARGFGHTIAEYKKPLSEVMVENPTLKDITRDLYSILGECDKLRREGVSESDLRAKFEELLSSVDDRTIFEPSDEHKDAIFKGFLLWDGQRNTSEHQGLIRLVSNICAEYAVEMSFKSLVRRLDLEIERYDDFAAGIMNASANGGTELRGALLWSNSEKKAGFRKDLDSCGISTEEDFGIIADAVADIAYIMAYKNIVLASAFRIIRDTYDLHGDRDNLPESVKVLVDKDGFLDIIGKMTDRYFLDLADFQATHYKVDALERFMAVSLSRLKEKPKVVEKLKSSIEAYTVNLTSQANRMKAYGLD